MTEEKYLFKTESYEKGKLKWTQYAYGAANKNLEMSLVTLSWKNIDLEFNLKNLAKTIKDKYSKEIISNLDKEKLLMGPDPLSSTIRSPLDKKELKTLAKLISEIK